MVYEIFHKASDLYFYREYLFVVLKCKKFLPILFILTEISLGLPLVFWISIYVNSTGGKLFSIFVDALFLWNTLCSHVITTIHSPCGLGILWNLYISSHYIRFQKLVILTGLTSEDFQSCHFIQLLIHLFDKYLRVDVTVLQILFQTMEEKNRQNEF